MMAKHKSLSGVWIGSALISGPIIPDKSPIIISMSVVMAEIETLLIGEMSADSSYNGSHYYETGVPIRGAVHGSVVEFAAEEALFRGQISSCFNKISGVVTSSRDNDSIGGPFELERCDSFPSACIDVPSQEFAVV